MTETIPHPRGDAAEPDLSPAPEGDQGGDPALLVIYAPMRIEARAIRRGLDPASPAEVLRTGSATTVLRTGWGTIRAAQAAGQVSHRPFGPMAVMGVGAGLTADLRPGPTPALRIKCRLLPRLLRGDARRVIFKKTPILI